MDDDPAIARLNNALLPQQKTALLNSWRKAGGDNGRYNEKLLHQTFEKFAQKDSDVALIFNKAAATQGFSAGGQAQSIMTMSDHAMKLTELIDVIIRKLNNEPIPDRKKQYVTIQQIGQHHAHLGQHGLTRALWDLFGQVLAGKLANQQMIRGQRLTQRSWMTFVAVFMDQLVSGFDRGTQLCKYAPSDRLEKAMTQATYLKQGVVPKWRKAGQQSVESHGSDDEVAIAEGIKNSDKNRRKSAPTFDNTAGTIGKKDDEKPARQQKRRESVDPSSTTKVGPGGVFIRNRPPTKSKNPFAYVSHPHIAQALDRPPTAKAKAAAKTKQRQRAQSMAEVRLEAEQAKRVKNAASKFEAEKRRQSNVSITKGQNGNKLSGFKSFANRFNLKLKLGGKSGEDEYSHSSSDLRNLAQTPGSSRTTPMTPLDGSGNTPRTAKYLSVDLEGEASRKRSCSIGDVENLRRQLDQHIAMTSSMQQPGTSKDYAV